MRLDIEVIVREYPHDPEHSKRWVVLWRDEKGHGYASKYIARDEIDAYKRWIIDMKKKEQTNGSNT